VINEREVSVKNKKEKEKSRPVKKTKEIKGSTLGTKQKCEGETVAKRKVKTNLDH